MKITVTGAAGFIGSHLCERLLKEGNIVWGLDNFDPYYDVSVKEGNIALLERYPTFHLMRGDIRDVATLEELWRKAEPDCVVHLAAHAGVRPSIAKPAVYSEVNVTALIHLFEIARRYQTAVVFASSSSVYGSSNKTPYREDDPAANPISPYAATKRAGELFASTYHHLYQMPVVCLRFFTVYGPRQRPDMAIHKFAKALLQDQPVTLFGDGSAARDYTYVDDIVDGIAAAIKKTPQLGYNIFNLGDSRVVTLLELVRLLEKITGKTARVIWEEKQPGDVALTFADISHANKMLGYAPKIPIDIGLERTVSWLKTQSF